MIKWTTHIFWREEFGRNSFVPLWWLQWSCLVTWQYFLDRLFVGCYAGPIHMSFSLYYAGSLPWLFYYLFITVGSLFVLLIITGTLWVAGKVCPGQGRVAVQKVPDLLQQRWMLSPTTPEQLAQAPGHGGQQEQSSQGNERASWANQRTWKALCQTISSSESNQSRNHEWN